MKQHCAGSPKWVDGFPVPSLSLHPWGKPCSDSSLSSGEHSCVQIPLSSRCSIGLEWAFFPAPALFLRLAPTFHWVSAQETCVESPNPDSASVLWALIMLGTDPQTRDILSLCYDPLCAHQCPPLDCKPRTVPSTSPGPNHNVSNEQITD